MRHVLTNVVGARDKVEVHVQELTLEPGDRLLLCSDGVHEPVGEDGIRTMLDASDAGTAAAQLVTTALKRGGRDNATALVVHVEAVL